MTRRRMWGAGAMGLAAIVAIGCGGKSTESTDTGGDTATGGDATPGSGGDATETGGQPSGGDGPTGGTSPAGGASTGGSSSTGGGGNPSGGTGATENTGGTGGTENSGGTGVGGDSAGGMGGTGGDDPTGGAGGDPDGTTAATDWTDTVPQVEDVAVTDSPTCEPPCGVVMAPDDRYVGGAEGATLFYDPATGTATLRNDPDNAGADEVAIISFTWEPDDYGYGAWVSSPLFWVFAQNTGYDYGYSDWADTLIRAQIHDPDTDTDYIVVYSYDGSGTHGARIHEVRIPSCNAEGEGRCISSSDCPLVEAGSTGLSADCQTCYDRLDRCTTVNCPDDCPGGAGNGCLNCQTDAECHIDFMNCSGLDYMPPNTLKLPDW